MEAAKGTQKPPGIMLGALVGALLTAPLIAVQYLGDQAVGLPFVPFDVFALVRDLLPGDIITKGIDTMVEVITSLDLGRVDATAKTVERITALGMTAVFGAVVAAALFKLLRPGTRKNALLYGVVTGLVAGIVMALISADKDITSTTTPTASAIWIVASFIIWGGGLSWVYDRLTIVAEPESLEVLEPAPVTSAPAPPSVKQLDRREFLVQIGGITAVLTVSGAGLGLWLACQDDENDGTVRQVGLAVAPQVAEVTPEATPPPESGLQPAPGTRPEYTPLEDHYRIDIAPRSPVIEEAEWWLAVTGMLAAPVALTLDELRQNYEPVDQIITLSCISNPIAGSLISTTRWTGVPLRVLLEEWEIDPLATHLKISSADGFFEYLDLSLARDDERVMFAYAWDGQPLTRDHGFPLRIYIPDRYGMKQPKWITNIEVIREWDEGYWVRRGWSREAIAQQTSVIDTVAVDATYQVDGQVYVPVGGIAYAGAKGITKVEVSVDDGEWVEAQLREPLSDLTWVLWRYDWPFVEGRHRFCVRCVDGRGNPQIEQNGEREPDGMRGARTGLHCVREEIGSE